MDKAAVICARLLREGSVRRAALPDLDLVDVRQEVEQRLRWVGLVLSFTVYSEHVGVRLSSEVARDPAFDKATNAGLGEDHCVLLAICWVRLVLPKRLHGTLPEPPERPLPLLRGQWWYPPVQLPLEVLHRLLRFALGGRSRLRNLAGKLRQSKFLSGQGEILLEGPLLELGLDGGLMTDAIRRDILPALRREKEREARGPEPREEGEPEEDAAPLGSLEKEVLAVLRQRGGSAAMGELSRMIERPAVRLRKVLRALEDAGHVRRTGDRAGTRYHIVRR
jgi:hypothetical protein